MRHLILLLSFWGPFFGIYSMGRSSSADMGIGDTKEHSTQVINQEKEISMATTKFKGEVVHLNGAFMTVGDAAPQVQLVKSDLAAFSLDEHKGKYIVLNVFPSIDTGVCAMSVRKFNQLAASLPNTVVLCVSRDLPFAQSRFCGAEGIGNVMVLSDFRRESTFGRDYGVEMADGPLAGLLARAVVVIAPDGKVCHAELVPEITTEPNYEAALSKIAN